MLTLVVLIGIGIVLGGWQALEAFDSDKVVKGVVMAIITVIFILLLVLVPPLREAL